MVQLEMLTTSTFKANPVRAKQHKCSSPALIITIHAEHVQERFLLLKVWESEEYSTCVCVAAYAHFQLSIITLGDTPHMTNEQDVGAQR